MLPGPHFCTVVDRSATGFKLHFRGRHNSRQDFLVVLVASGLAFAVSARWSKDSEVGALITSQCDLNGLTPSAFAEARQFWNRLKRPADRS